MKAQNLILLVLLVVGSSAVSAQSTSAANLLQEGIYAERTEGDLQKAISLYEQVLEQYKETEHLAARATFQLGICYLKKGDNDRAADYFQKVVREFPEQRALADRAAKELEKIEPKESVFEQIDLQTARFISEKLGETALEANQKNLLVNSHIYYISFNGYCYRGGMNSFYNWTGRTINQRTRFGGTSFPNQTHYDALGNKLNTEIVPDETRPNHWQIYWFPDEPLAPGESLYYGWSIDEKFKLPQPDSETFSLRMQNQFGSPVIETFFLVLPKNMKIAQSSPPTGSEKLLNFDVYWWTKQVAQGENHVETVSIKKVDITKAEKQRTADSSEAVKSALSWLELVDSERYAQSWDAAASFSQGAVTKDQWITAIQSIRKPLGKPISREVISKTPTKQVPGAPDGDYVIIQLKTSFENKREAVETITPMLDLDGKWRVSGYFIK